MYTWYVYIYINIYHVGMFWCPVGACMIVYVQIPNMGNFGWLVAGWRKKTAKSSKKRSFQWNECKNTFIYIYTQGIVFWLLCARFCPPYQNLEWVVLMQYFHIDSHLNSFTESNISFWLIYTAFYTALLKFRMYTPQTCKWPTF